MNTLTAEECRALIRATVKDLVGTLLDYGRKDDEELTEEVLTAALKDGTITNAEIVDWFRRELEANT